MIRLLDIILSLIILISFIPIGIIIIIILLFTGEGEVFYKPVAYSASKSGIYNLTRYLAIYWAREGIRVNTLTLAGVFNDQEEEFLEEYNSRMPMGRMANIEDYLGPLVFLASESSRYMTGADLVIDGGWTAK